MTSRCFCARQVGQPDEECTAAGECVLVLVRGPRRLWVETRHAAVMAGYWVRPYNDLLDRRIWRWQKRPLCGWMGGRPWEWP